MNISDSSLPSVLPEDAAALATAVAGSVLLPGDAGLARRVLAVPPTLPGRDSLHEDPEVLSDQHI